MPGFYVDRYAGRKGLIVTWRQILNLDMTRESMHMGERESIYMCVHVCMSVFMCVCMSACACLCICVNVCINVCIYVCRCMYVCMCVCIYVYMYELYVCVCMYMYIWTVYVVYMYIYVCVCMCACVCIDIYAHTKFFIRFAVQYLLTFHSSLLYYNSICWCWTASRNVYFELTQENFLSFSQNKFAYLYIWKHWRKTA